MIADLIMKTYDECEIDVSKKRLLWEVTIWN